MEPCRSDLEREIKRLEEENELLRRRLLIKGLQEENELLRQRLLEQTRGGKTDEEVGATVSCPPSHRVDNKDWRLKALAEDVESGRVTGWADLFPIIVYHLVFLEKAARPNVTPGGETIALGAVPVPNSMQITCSRETDTRANLLRILTGMARHKFPGFRFSSIQCNGGGTKSKLHTDDRNRGQGGRIVGVAVTNGKMVGGELFLKNDHGPSEMKIEAGKYRINGKEEEFSESDVIRGNKIAIQNKEHEFQGETPHCTCPFEGSERFFFGFYEHSRITQLPAESCEKLRGLGFNLSDDAGSAAGANDGEVLPSYSPLRKAITPPAVEAFTTIKQRACIGAAMGTATRDEFREKKPQLPTESDEEEGQAGLVREGRKEGTRTFLEEDKNVFTDSDAEMFGSDGFAQAQRASNFLHKIHADDTGRALIHAVTGAGKSRLIHYRILTALESGSLVVLVTSRLLLIDQLCGDMVGKLSAEWGKLFSECSAMLFCSLNRPDRAALPGVGTSRGLRYVTCSTKEEDLANFLNTNGKKIVLVTYSSFANFWRTFKEVGQRAEAMLFDEAHRTVGDQLRSLIYPQDAAQSDKFRQLVKTAIFLTATPRDPSEAGRIVMKPKTKQEATEGDCGPVFEYLYHEAVKDRVIRSFAPIVLALTKGGSDGAEAAGRSTKRVSLLEAVAREILSSEHKNGRGERYARVLVAHGLAAESQKSSDRTSAADFSSLESRGMFIEAFNRIQKEEFGKSHDNAFDLNKLRREDVTAKTSRAASCEDGILADFKEEPDSKSISVIHFCDVLNEGVDLPYVTHLFWATPRGSREVVTQQIGRGFRVPHFFQNGFGERLPDFTPFSVCLLIDIDFAQCVGTGPEARERLLNTFATHPGYETALEVALAYKSELDQTLWHKERDEDGKEERPDRKKTGDGEKTERESVVDEVATKIGRRPAFQLRIPEGFALELRLDDRERDQLHQNDLGNQLSREKDARRKLCLKLSPETTDEGALEDIEPEWEMQMSRIREWETEMHLERLSRIRAKWDCTNDYALRLQRLRARLMSAKFILLPVDAKKCDAMVVPNWPILAPDPGTKPNPKVKYWYTRVMARSNMKVANTHFKLSNSVAYPDALIIEDYSSNGTCINGRRIPGDSLPKAGLVRDGDIISLSGNELPEDLDESSTSLNVRLRVEYTPVPKRFEATEVDALFNQLEEADNITKEMLNDTGLAREMRYWKDADAVKQKEPELAERAAHLFQLWRDKFKDRPAAG
eukprot:g10882.t1